MRDPVLKRERGGGRVKEEGEKEGRGKEVGGRGKGRQGKERKEKKRKTIHKTTGENLTQSGYYVISINFY